MLSSVLSYHFSFLAISLALLGTGVGALLVYLRPTWFDRRPLDTSVARLAIVFGCLLVVTPLILVHLDYEIRSSITARFVFALTVVSLVAAAVSLASGAVVALAIRHYADHLGRVYAWDLVGAGLGALVIVPLLHSPAPQLLVWLGLVAFVAAALFGWHDRGTLIAGGAAELVAIVVLAISSVGSLLYLPMVTGVEQDELAADTWHPLSRVQTQALPGLAYSLLFYDRVFAPVPNVVGNDLPDWEDMLVGPASVGYEITGPGHALIIGGGGGRDIYNALTSDQTVDVIELNSAIRDAVDDSLAEQSASPYTRPGVSTTIGDGRSVLAGRDTKYDQIHIGFTDTLSANAAQGFALTESNLYTVEAFEEYLDHLQPRGILNVSRPERLVGDEALRVTVLTMAALERHGVTDIGRHMVVLRGVDSVGLISSQYMTVLARLEPYSDAELATIRRLANERGNGLAYIEDGPYYGPWAQLAEEGWETFCSGYELNVCPPTDDQPFFFNMRRLGDMFSGQTGYHYGIDPYQLLLLTLAVLLVLSAIGFLLPLRLSRSSEQPSASSLTYFAAIGLGFLLLEIGLIQRFVLFLGFPTYALSVVLFALLLFTGIGAAITTRLPHTKRTTVTVLAVVTALVTISAFALQPALRAMIGIDFPWRVILTIVILAPLGIGLGMPMTLGLSRFAALYPRSIAYAWGVNGIASVLASVLGVVVAINFGYTVASLVAACCYVFAGAHAAAGLWADDTPDDIVDDDATAGIDVRVGSQLAT